MEAIILLTVGLLALFAGICIGAIITVITESSFHHLEEKEVPYPIYKGIHVDVNDFDDCAKVLIKYLAENHHPHMTVIVTSTNAHLFEGVTSTGEVLEYIKD
ncbi:hypothetical protein [Chryseobacterium sp. R2A-55]|uniref:hypothetical protein n=1 Tax=Chryseobacterium sp. R2A-55 TaxID=2744445 RepID=UPI001F3BB7A8|nr:hypothetical protein [Chryseobacterium sp. R2A-55]